MTDNTTENNRITMLRELLQMSQTEFSRRIGISQGALSQIESGRSRLSMETLQSLSNAFNVNCNWLVNGKGEIFSPSEMAGNDDKNKSWKGIPFVNEKARAGYIKRYNNIDFLNTLETYYIPGFENSVKYRLFEIAGNSMSPTLFPSEIVIAQKKSKGIKDEILGIFLTKDNLLAKRAKVNWEDKGQINLMSDNPEFHNMNMDVNKVLEIWEIKGKITKKLLKNYPFDTYSFNKMEKDIHDLKYQLSSLLNKKDNH